MAATPKRAANAERALIGANLHEPASWRAAFRMSVAANLLEKALLKI
jgi:xanthine dehydrogenase iron-sulfur cluster and FAD-binding subunit A